MTIAACRPTTEEWIQIEFAGTTVEDQERALQRCTEVVDIEKMADISRRCTSSRPPRALRVGERAGEGHSAPAERRE